MQIKILRLDITAFKGIRSLSLLLDGKDATIRGRNGSGKTSVYDAFLWLLFGKDSTGAAKFDVRPLNDDGTPKTGSDTEVECELLVDGKAVKLKRSLHEKYRAVPGGKPVYAGVEALCWIDDVPVKLEKDYQPYVAKLVGSEDTFKLLAIHGHFLRLRWEQRRKYLVDAAGGSAEAELLLKPEFEGVSAILQGHSVEDARKRLKDQIKRMTAEIQSIPGRIDELRKALPDVTATQYQDAHDRMKKLSAEIELVNNQMSGGLEAFKQARALMDEERRITAQMDVRRVTIYKPHEDARRECAEALENARQRLQSQQREFERMNMDAASIKASISRLQDSREKKLAEWHAVNDEAYTPPVVTTVCAYCGQPLPEHKIQEMLDNDRTGWEMRKTARLDEISTEGRTTAERINNLQRELDGINETLDRKYTFLAENRKHIADLEAQQKELDKPSTIKLEDDPEYADLSNQLAALRMQMASTTADSGRAELEKQRSDLLAEQQGCQEIITRYGLGQTMLKRVDELLDRQKAVGADVARAEGDLDLLNRFSTACCTAMEDTINDMFSLIRWKLFDYQKNGEVKDCCTATVFGIPFDTGLNHAAQINAGIETIRVLSKGFGVSVPCFVDNAEAVNTLEYTGGQMIKLTVSNDPELTLVREE